MFDYILIRDQWNRVRIKILPDGKIEVRASKRISKKKIEEILQKHTDFIEAGQEKARVQEAKKAEYAEKPLERLPYMGSYYPVKAGKNVSFNGQSFSLPDLDCPSYAYKERLEKCYRELAAAYLPERTLEIGKMLGVTPSAVKINGAKTRWGSCSGKNSINFSWRLMLMPPQAIDYVIVHELCHIVHHDHSAAFWQAVGAVMPDYQSRKALLVPHRT